MPGASHSSVIRLCPDLTAALCGLCCAHCGFWAPSAGAPAAAAAAAAAPAAPAAAVALSTFDISAAAAAAAAAGGGMLLAVCWLRWVVLACEGVAGAGLCEDMRGYWKASGHIMAMPT